MDISKLACYFIFSEELERGAAGVSALGWTGEKAAEFEPFVSRPGSVSSSPTDLT